MRYELVVFDLDGTLADSRTGVWRAVAEACVRAGLAEPSRELVEGLVGLPLYEVVGRGAGLDLDADRARIEGLMADYRGCFAEVALPLTRLIDGVEALLDRLESAGRRLAIATSKPVPAAESVLRHVGLDGRFAFVGGGDLVPAGEGKPGPALLLRVLGETGGAAERTLLVGDTSFDMEMACRAGADAAGVTWGSHGAARLQASGATAVFDCAAALGDFALR